MAVSLKRKQSTLSQRRFHKAFENISRALVQRIEFHATQTADEIFILKNASKELAKDEYFCVYARALQANIDKSKLITWDDLITGTLDELANNDWINYYDHKNDPFHDTVEVIFNSDNL